MTVLTQQVKAKEDPEVERKTGEWIEDVLGRALEDTSDLYKSLKNGVALCEYVLCRTFTDNFRLVNKIYPGVVKKFNKEVPGQPMHVLRERVCTPFTDSNHSLLYRRTLTSILRLVTGWGYLKMPCS